MEKYLLLLIAGVNAYFCYKFISDETWAKNYVEYSPKAWIWRKVFGTTKALKVIRGFFVPIGVIFSLFCIVLFFVLFSI